MPYTPTTWVNGTAPGISATNLNKIETGIDTAHDDLDTATSAATANKLARRDVNGDSSFRRVTSTIATGNAPLVVASTTKVINLNAELVDGFNPDSAAVALTIALRDAQGDLLARQFESSATTGTAPLVIASTTMVTNLNVDRVDGIHFRLTGEVLERSTDGVIWKGVGNLIDVTSLTPLTKDASAITGTGALQTILSITGEGFLESFYGLQIGAQAGFTVKITVDGVVKVLLVSATAANAIGVVSKNDIVVSGTSTTQGSTLSGAREQNSMSFDAVNSDSAAFKEYPTADSTAGIILLGDSKIYFTTSLLLEISCSASTNYKYHYSGGFK